MFEWPSVFRLDEGSTKAVQFSQYTNRKVFLLSVSARLIIPHSDHDILHTARIANLSITPQKLASCCISIGEPIKDTCIYLSACSKWCTLRFVLFVRCRLCLYCQCGFLCWCHHFKWECTRLVFDFQLTKQTTKLWNIVVFSTKSFWIKPVSRLYSYVEFSHTESAGDTSSLSQWLYLKAFELVALRSIYSSRHHPSSVHEYPQWKCIIW